MAGSSLRVVLVEPYFTGSHQQWAEGFARHSRHRVTLVTHAGQFWKWRMQGGALTLARALVDDVVRQGPVDVVVVSDMVHLPALVGLARSALHGAAVVAWFHENQLTYPLPDGTARDLTYAVTNWLSMAAADRVVFNSEHHRAEWFGALPALLRHFPDHRHTGFVDEVAARVRVLPVGLDAVRLAALPRRSDGGPPVVLWNQRWEADKDPTRFLAALRRLDGDGRGPSFRVALAGERFVSEPPELDRARRWLGNRLVADGHLERDAYERLLARADVVVSTARHDFFGVAVAEATAAGAVPVVPAGLAYRQFLPPWSHDDCCYDDDAGLDARLQRTVADDAFRQELGARLRPALSDLDWSAVAPRYDDLLDEAADARSR